MHRLFISLAALLMTIVPALTWTSLPALGASAPTEGQKPNRLLKEASPYLRQHAYNPINWYPWGKEAFDTAKRENKPIFLSVGYSTCYWCHVMEKESFSNAEIGKILNDNFIAIKVDRERRPDVDETYMLATQLITRSGGWPNNLFLTPDLKPFYAGTYFPRDPFAKLLLTVATQWTANKDPIIADGERVAVIIGQVMNRRVKSKELTTDSLKQASKDILGRLDTFNGGFGTAPKFPNEPVLAFLLRMADRHGDKEALKAVRLTLDAMLNGGIHDQIGGGFHRYATDNDWLIPHFEKMLYNQAQITKLLTSTWLLTQNERYRAAARRAIDYVLRDMTAKTGGFYSAYDAGEPGHEGIFYLWTEAQLLKALGKEDAAFAGKVFGVSANGNFEGKNILHFAETPADAAYELKIPVQVFMDRVEKLRSRLIAVRVKRTKPHLDAKIVTAWNGLMISAIAHAAKAFDEPAYSAAAIRAANFIWDKMRTRDGRLYRSYFDGKAALDGQQEDYANMALAFIALYDATGTQKWLDRAQKLATRMVADFRDKDHGDYFMTVSAQTFSRVKARNDSAVPSGNAQALEVFAALNKRDRDPENRINGEALLAALSGLALGSPQGNATTLRAADILLRGETGSSQYLAKGVVKASASYDRDSGKLSISLDIAKGWHINSDKPLEDFFIPTKLEITSSKEPIKTSIDYPAHKLLKLGFHDKPLALYDGKIEISALLDAKTAKDQKPGALKAKLHLQACSDEICLEPETVRLSFRPKNSACHVGKKE